MGENPYTAPATASVPAARPDGTPADDCPLSRGQQTLNLCLFAICTGLIYLAAPVLYVGVTQASLVNRLGGSSAVANMPNTAFFLMTVAPVFVAWLFPFVSYLKRTLVTCFAIVAAILAAVAVVMVLPVPPSVKIAAVVLQGGLCGAALPTAVALLWEMVGRGVVESRRGQALGLAFGFGPVLAVIGSLGSQLLLTGQMWRLEMSVPSFPWNFAALFAAGVPVMALAAILASRCVVPLPSVELKRESFREGVIGGLLNFVTDRILLTAMIVTLLLYTGNVISSNMNLYTEIILGPPEQYASYQNALRFTFKVVAGIALGWTLLRTNPRTGILLTAAFFILSQVYAVAVTGEWYLVAFGLLGAGELVGVYAPNYILSASRPDQMRRNMAVVTMLMAPVAPLGTFFGWVADFVGGLEGPQTGFRTSFVLCGMCMLAGVVVALRYLPPRPRSVLAD